MHSEQAACHGGCRHNED